MAFDVVHASLSENQGGSDNNDHLETTALSAGPWLRWAMGRTLDGRVDVVGALDIQYRRQSATLRSDTDLLDQPLRAAGGVLAVIHARAAGLQLRQHRGRHGGAVHSARDLLTRNPQTDTPGVP